MQFIVIHAVSASNDLRRLLRFTLQGWILFDWLTELFACEKAPHSVFRTRVFALVEETSHLVCVSVG